MENLIKLQCPTCRRRLKISESSLAKSIVCPKCNCRFRIGETGRPTETGREDLFGPPVIDDFLSLKDSSNELFDDVEQIIEDNSDGKPPHDSTASECSPVSHTNVTSNLPSISDQWRKQKKITSKFDDSLNRNGIGLMILAFGLSAIPIFAHNVDSMQIVLAYLPIAAVFVAMVAAFMLAYSLRQRSLASIILSGLPVLFVGFISLISYLFYVDSEFGESNKNNTTAVSELPIEKTDKDLLLDKAPVMNNVVENFAPPKKQLDPVTLPFSPIATKPTDGRDTPQKSKRPSQEKNKRATIHDRPQVANAKEESANPTKSEVLRNRVNNKLLKSLFTKNRIAKGEHDFEGFQLSELMGQDSVYGTAVYSGVPIRGFDICHYRGMKDRWIDQIVPIIDVPEFNDSFVVADGSSLLGLRLNFDSQGIIGIQPIIGSSNEAPKYGEWIGQSAILGTSKTETVLSDGEVHGFVIYRAQRTAIGLRLIESKRKFTQFN